MLELPTDLSADLVPLSWLIGVWEGTGVVDYPGVDAPYAGEFIHRVSFSHDGGDALNYSASARLMADDGTPGAALISEVGYWRLARPLTDADAGPGLLPPRAAPTVRTVDDVEALRTEAGGFEIEAALVHSDGTSELYVGQVTGPRIELGTDAVVRPVGGKDYSAATRMYGLVDGHLLWAWDIAAVGQELRAHASARLAKVE